MKKKLWLKIILIIILTLLVVLLFLIFRSSTKNFAGFVILRNIISNPFFKIINIGRIFINVLFLVNVDSPRNITYNFSIGNNYALDLNVSSNRNITGWWYTLEDLRHASVVNSSVIFTPNLTISTVRWNNRITVFANDSGGNLRNKSIEFFVNVPNSAPVIKNISNNIYVCEGNYLSYTFNVTDNDEDVPTVSMTLTNPFYISFFHNINLTTNSYEIFSGTLSKNDVGGVNGRAKVYSENISVNDNYNSTCCIDSKKTNITAIEINNAPVIQNIGVQTVYAVGANNSFYYSVQVNDTESGNQDSGSLIFNLSFSGGVNLFNISSNGIMNFTPNSSQVGVYNISVCVTDPALLNPHENISLCGQNGSNRTSCQNFSLTVTLQNRAPQIISYYPTTLNFSVYEGSSVYFNMSKYDPDGTIPDAYWYVDYIFQEYDYGSLIDNLTYTFNCTSAGNHSVTGKITDGVINYSYDYVTWNISVLDLAGCFYCGDNVCQSSESCSSCPGDCGVCSTGGGGGGGGGGGSMAKPSCKEKWGCNEWGQCGNLENSYNLKNISYDYNFLIKERCKVFNWKENVCGFQIRDCKDVDNCKTNFSKPSIIRECYYTEYPNCEDNILNCHDGSCEVLIDCGGPCKPCPSCSDGAQNQGEEGIDCGVPCKPCIKEIPAPIFNKFVLFVSALVLISLVLIIFLVFKYHKHGRELNKFKKN